jgi:hypothetical protein
MLRGNGPRTIRMIRMIRGVQSRTLRGILPRMLRTRAKPVENG